MVLNMVLIATYGGLDCCIMLGLWSHENMMDHGENLNSRVGLLKQLRTMGDSEEYFSLPGRASLYSRQGERKYSVRGHEFLRFHDRLTDFQ